MIRYTYDYIKQKYQMNKDLNEDIRTVVDGFIYNKQYKNFKDGQTPGRRAAFMKTHGGAYAKFTISHAELDDNDPNTGEIKRGLFSKEAEYEAWVRFASDINFDKKDQHSTVGCSIKLFNVPGLNVLDYKASKDGESQLTTVDFALQNYPVFFARDAHQMAGYKAAAQQGADALKQFKEQPANQQLAKIINKMMAQDPSSVLAETYWSCVPFILGIPENGSLGRLCKYILTPRKNQPTLPPKEKTRAGFLREDLIDNIKASSYFFDFYIHLRTSNLQSADDASDNWTDPNNTSPDVAPFGTNDTNHIYKVGTLEILQQNIAQRGQDEYIETLAFNPWRTLPDNIPYGEIALARRISYEIAAKSRRDLNGQPVGEPILPRPLAFNDAPYGAAEHDIPWSDISTNPAPAPGPGPEADTEIVRVAIHPGIGVARVGNSELPGDDWIIDQDNYHDIYIGPETDTPPPMTLDRIRDKSSKIKRQAARFRLYGFNAKGEVVKEILPSDPNTSIAWSVTLANRKAQWFTFEHAWDKAFFFSENDKPSGLRNPLVSDRASLAVTPEKMTISGKAQRSTPIKGKFKSIDVTLGELRTDSDGRLLILGGKGGAGTSASASDPDYKVLNGNGGTFNNAQSWYDDISDGPVHAEVVINGKSYDVDSAWVITAPPNYAPDIVGFRTLYELLEEVYIEAGMLPMPEEVSFTKHILPSLQRLSKLSWVNEGFHDIFGPGKQYDFENLDSISMLKTVRKAGNDIYKSARKSIFEKFHHRYNSKTDPNSWPLLYGDAFGEDGNKSGPFLNVENPEDMSSLSSIRYAWFKKWADGDFIDDTASSPQNYTSIDDVPLSDQPAMLDKAALHFCLADAFHPGCEVTWPMRHVSIYRAPYRIREAAPDKFHEPALNDTFDYIAAHTPGGALAAQPPGGLTRWMALPWHGDTARCRAGYDADYGQYTPAYWPARVPNHVLTQESYGEVMNRFGDEKSRQEAFNTRENWWRHLSANPDSRDRADEEEQTQYMINNYDRMGIILRTDGPEKLSGVPEELYVEYSNVQK
ncbi:catalase [Ochrobactrum sp. CM-21-5]|nr:LodA/GoxA family CTQ-dependent oxidase [Ochrobactrum sp. CM-21-5]MBC2886318.1 catalase [Ochrobactrum sp. CM-21-5]